MLFSILDTWKKSKYLFIPLIGIVGSCATTILFYEIILKKGFVLNGYLQSIWKLLSTNHAWVETLLLVLFFTLLGLYAILPTASSSDAKTSWGRVIFISLQGLIISNFIYFFILNRPLNINFVTVTVGILSAFLPVLYLVKIGKNTNLVHSSYYWVVIVFFTAMLFSMNKYKVFADNNIIDVGPFKDAIILTLIFAFIPLMYTIPRIIGSSINGKIVLGVILFLVCVISIAILIIELDFIETSKSDSFVNSVCSFQNAIEPSRFRNWVKWHLYIRDLFFLEGFVVVPFIILSLRTIYKHTKTSN
jgi:hypothetical protein